MLQRVSDVPSQLDRIEAKLERLESSLAQLSDLPGVIGTMGNTFDDLVDRGKARGIDPDALVDALFRTDLLRRDNIEILSRAVADVGNVADAGHERFGIIPVLKALREPEVQRTLMFLIGFARRFGTILDDVERPELLPPGEEG